MFVEEDDVIGQLMSVYRILQIKSALGCIYMYDMFNLCHHKKHYYIYIVQLSQKEKEILVQIDCLGYLLWLLVMKLQGKNL